MVLSPSNKRKIAIEAYKYLSTKTKQTSNEIFLKMHSNGSVCESVTPHILSYILLATRNVKVSIDSDGRNLYYL